MATVDGPPVFSAGDPRPEKRNCLEQTVRNKISRMTYLHVFFGSYGATKFSRAELYGWQDLIGVNLKSIDQAFKHVCVYLILSGFWRGSWTVYGFQPTEWGGAAVLL